VTQTDASDLIEVIQSPGRRELHPIVKIVDRFLPAFLRTCRALSAAQHHAIQAMQQCRTQALGGSVHGCDDCGGLKFSYHSCNHKICPLCGAAATADWVQREQAKLIDAPYFMVTFTVPSELRALFMHNGSKESYDALFHAVSTTLKGALARLKELGAIKTGFTMVLHTWNQQMLPHIHVHCIVPGAGLDKNDQLVKSQNAEYLACVDLMEAAFRSHMGAELRRRNIECDPVVWQKKWSVNIKPFGTGENAVKYLGTYVSRSVIGKSRIERVTDQDVTYLYRDRKTNQQRRETISGIEFIRRFIRHVMPSRMHSVRYAGFHHASGKKIRARMQELCPSKIATAKPAADTTTETATDTTTDTTTDTKKVVDVQCPCCQKAMTLLGNVKPWWKRKKGDGSDWWEANTEHLQLTNDAKSTDPPTGRAPPMEGWYPGPT
jgi:Putative transposase/Transposase zinc-binding domain